MCPNYEIDEIEESSSEMLEDDVDQKEKTKFLLSQNIIKITEKI